MAGWGILAFNSKETTSSFITFTFCFQSFLFVCFNLRGLFSAWKGIFWFESARHVWINFKSKTSLWLQWTEKNQDNFEKLPFLMQKNCNDWDEVTWKVFEKHPIWKLSIKPGNFPDYLETFQFIWKLCRSSGNFLVYFKTSQTI